MNTSSGEQASLLDPVCGMRVPGDAPLRYVHDGVTHGFCRQGCEDRFLADPAQYAAPKAVGTGETCPMHPEVRERTPILVDDIAPIARTLAAACARWSVPTRGRRSASSCTAC